MRASNTCPFKYIFWLLGAFGFVCYFASLHFFFHFQLPKYMILFSQGDCNNTPPPTFSSAERPCPSSSRGGGSFPSPWICTGSSDLVAINRIWHKWCYVTCKARSEKALNHIRSIYHPLSEHKATTLWESHTERSHPTELSFKPSQSKSQRCE